MSQDQLIGVDSHASDAGGPPGHGAVDHPHVVSPLILLSVFAALLLGTVVTVGVTYLPNMGPGNIIIAMTIALMKGALVVFFFMHLKWDSPFNGLVLVIALFFLALFIGIAALDTDQNLPSITAPTINAQQ